MSQHPSLSASSTVSRSTQAPIAWRHMVGIALLWCALATLVYLAAAERPSYAPWLAIVGFAAFATGLSLFADALRRAIVQDLMHAERS